MRGRIILLLVLLSGTALQAGEANPAADSFDRIALDRQLYESLKEIHNRGAQMYNRGDALGCQRLFEGSLEVARTALHYRPEEQKLLREGLEKAARIETAFDRAYALHDLIEEVRKRLAKRETPKAPAAAETKAIIMAPKSVEVIPVPPREQESKPGDLPFKELGPKHPLNLEPRKLPKAEADPRGKEAILVGNVAAPAIDAAAALTGQLFWKGEGLEGVKLMFVQRDGSAHRVFETVTGPEGRYALPNFQVGKYTVLLNPVPSQSQYQLPSRYQTTTDSPLIYFLSPGEKHDFLLK